MIAIKTVDIRNDFKRISDLVTAGERVLIARPHNENLVVLSEREYNELDKMRRNAAYLAMLDESVRQYETGHVVVKTMEELEEMAL